MASRWIGLAIAALLLASPAVAQELELGGEVRPRFELRDRGGASGSAEFTSLRTRLGLTVALEPSITAFVQLQDVRVFGEETGTLSDYDADGLDLHQGWAELGDAEADRWTLRIGRQEAAYGGERLVGAVNWAQQGRAFDGARLRFRPSPDVVLDGIAFRINDSDVTGIARDHSLYGVYSTVEAAGDLDLFGLFSTLEAPAQSQDIYTLGVRWESSRDNLSWRLEGAYQGGEERIPGIEWDRSAFMLGARLGTNLTEALRGTLWYDYLSGDDDPDNTNRAFDTLFATNHKFYGYMDLFTDIPFHTNDRGLQDLAVKTEYDLGDGRVLAADLHFFALTADDGLESGHLGEELDVTYRWRYAPGVAVSGGLSYFLAGDSYSTPLITPDEDQAWGFLMLDVVF